MRLMARCERCGRRAWVEVVYVDEYEYSGWGVSEPDGWWSFSHCGDPCMPSDTGIFHSPWRDRSPVVGRITSVSEILGGIQVQYVADRIFPMIPIGAKSIHFTYTKGDR